MEEKDNLCPNLYTYCFILILHFIFYKKDYNIRYKLGET